MADLSVSGAGDVAVNGTYTKTGTYSGKTYWNISGTNPIISAISWEAGFWFLFDASGDLRYYATSNADPPTGLTWDINTGASPAPTVGAGGGGGAADSMGFFPFFRC